MEVGLRWGTGCKAYAFTGYETNARYSPDGKWIAFTGRVYGNGDVYVIPSHGGLPQRITFHSADDDVCSWSWDSKFIYFSSNRAGEISSYKVALKGGRPRRVLGHFFFQNDHHLFEAPGTGAIFFNNTIESSIFSQRKGYKGSNHPSIQSYNLKTGEYKFYTHYDGKDFDATLDRYGNIYYTGDQENGGLNIYTFRGGSPVALTHFPVSVKNAIVNAEGTSVIFEKGYQLYLYDVKTGSSRKIPVTLPVAGIAGDTRHFKSSFLIK